MSPRQTASMPSISWTSSWRSTPPANSDLDPIRYVRDYLAQHDIETIPSSTTKPGGKPTFWRPSVRTRPSSFFPDIPTWTRPSRGWKKPAFAMTSAMENSWPRRRRHEGLRRLRPRHRRNWPGVELRHRVPYIPVLRRGSRLSRRWRRSIEHLAKLDHPPRLAVIGEPFGNEGNQRPKGQIRDARRRDRLVRLGHSPLPPITSTPTNMPRAPLR